MVRSPRMPNQDFGLRHLPDLSASTEEEPPFQIPNDNDSYLLSHNDGDGGGYSFFRGTNEEEYSVLGMGATPVGNTKTKTYSTPHRLASLKSAIERWDDETRLLPTNTNMNQKELLNVTMDLDSDTDMDATEDSISINTGTGRSMTYSRHFGLGQPSNSPAQPVQKLATSQSPANQQKLTTKKIFSPPTTSQPEPSSSIPAIPNA
ncbi:hypothetical protein PQX77_021756 [Marasmius sp. AFHP31]|nr:hypothetical protein PQX77_021756 [Marasmius sp. AFHP31]